MKDYRDLAWQMERTIHKYVQYEKKPQTYCSNLVLTQPEIHTVSIIGDREGISVTQLAAERGITKGAVSQMVYKLVDKGLVEKRISPNSDSELNLHLTKTGRQAFIEHRKKHEAMEKNFEKMLHDLPDETQQSLTAFLKAFEDELDKLL